MPHTSDSDQALWVAAVLQARADIEDLPIGAMNYQAAVAFFTTEASVYILATEVSSAEAADMDARCAIPGLSARFAIRGQPDAKRGYCAGNPSNCLNGPDTNLPSR